MDANRYLRTMIATAAVLVAAVAAFNVAVDPLAVFGAPRIEGFNALKPEMPGRERESKLNAPELANARALVLGTSRAAIGLDPAALEPVIPGAYNLAFAGQSLHETRLVLEALAPGLAGSTVLVGLDFFAANATFDRDSATTARTLAQPRLRRLADIALSLDTADASLATIRGQDAAEVEALGRDYSPRGHLRLSTAYSARRGGANAMFEASERAYASEFYFPPPTRRFSWKDGERDTRADLEVIFAVARAHRIRLLAFLSPAHAHQWEVVEALGLWPEFEQFKRLVLSASEHAAAGAPSWPVRDFAGHFPEVSAALPRGSGETLATHWDSSHYREALGNMVAECVVRATPEAPGSFGARLEAATIDEHLGRLREMRAQWQSANPTEHEAVSRIAQSSRPARATIEPSAAARAEP
ncbi:MAG: hypothetical protein IPP91_04980 [Betaproteobacteria bacterium]|nr:hypothetical protein [Betaproteobacteria bacterium]